ncbi:MAG: IclR family transcriptional regulator [Nevskia sp.]|nr:IclR family transcriptional regulator [Nevskia sp.]
MARNPRTPSPTSSHAASLEAALEHSTVPAVSRAAAILRLLARAPEASGIQAIARELGIVPSTVLHILRTLVAEELVSVDPATKLYSLGPGVLLLARAWLGANRFASVVQPVLDAISRERAVTAMGVQVDGVDHMVVVAIARSEGMIQLHTQIGSRFPATISATGRCLAAFGGHDAEELRRRFRKLRWDNAPSLTEWEAQVAEARSRGYAIDRGNYIAGVTIVAAPVFGPERIMTHSLVVVGISGQMSDQALAQIGRELRDKAAQLSRDLGSG